MTIRPSLYQKYAPQWPNSLNSWQRR